MSRRRTLQHFTHFHPLTEYNGVGDFICDGCETYGHGKTFRCVQCNFDLHECCATSPRTLTSYVHSRHVLTLVVQNRRLPATQVCDMCDESILGMFYTCRACDFDVHPLCCTAMPRSVRHVLHPAHHLELRRGGASTCRVCNGTCRSWRYRCEMCRFDIHMECILTVCNVTSSSRGVQQRRVGPQQRLVQQQPRPRVMQQRLVQQPRPRVQVQVPQYGYGLNRMVQVPQYGYGLNPMVQFPRQHQAEESNRPSTGRRMFNLATRLAIGVVSNAVFGVPLDYLLSI